MRDPRLDNAKGVLIFLVVLGHFLESGLQGWSRPVPGTLLTLIYLFHMPAFVFLAGTTAKTEGLAGRLLTLAVLLVLFQAAYAVPLYVRDGSYPQSPWQPYWILWFLLSMLCWMAVLPLFNRLPAWAALGLSVLIGLGSGAVEGVGYPLGLSRTAVFLPCFIAGQRYGKAVFAALPRRVWIKAVLGLLFVALSVALYARFGTIHPWLYGSNNYAHLQVGAWTGAGIRLLLLAAASLGALALFALMPAREGVLSRVGAASLAVFLLHGFVLVFAGPKFKEAVLGRGLALELTAALLASLALTLLLGRPWLDRLVRAVSSWPARRLGLR